VISGPLPHSWTIGSGGLVGRSIDRALPNSFQASTIPWRDSETRLSALSNSTSIFFDHVGRDSWCIVWAAGAGTVGSDERSLEEETSAVQDFAFALADTLSDRSHQTSPGLCVLISSAGGVYAGTPDPPHSAHSTPSPISPYGVAKLAQERAWRRTLSPVCPTLTIRLSNVYGEGQRLDKRQGLISQLAYSAATRQPLRIYVPLDTVRDYIHADDAARLVAAHIRDRLVDSGDPSLQSEVIVASGEGTSIASLLRMMTDVSHRRIPVAASTSSSAASQAQDSRFIPDLPRGVTSSGARALPIGLQQVYQGIVRQLQDHGAGTRVVAP
tara:strand:+ start:380 stop:1360 length:981 start_codon:yes stop_codon:yes gene_type:complete